MAHAAASSGRIGAGSGGTHPRPAASGGAGDATDDVPRGALDGSASGASRRGGEELKPVCQFSGGPLRKPAGAWSIGEPGERGRASGAGAATSAGGAARGPRHTDGSAGDVPLGRGDAAE